MISSFTSTPLASILIFLSAIEVLSGASVVALSEPLASGVDTVTGTVTFTGCEAFVEAVAVLLQIRELSTSNELLL